VAYLVEQLLELRLVYLRLLELARAHFSLFDVNSGEPRTNDNTRDQDLVRHQEVYIVHLGRIRDWNQAWCRNEKVLDLSLMNKIIQGRFLGYFIFRMILT
jgi:hypothetical protein